MYIYIGIYIQYVYIYIYVFLYIHMYIYIYIYLLIYLLIYLFIIHIYIYIYILYFLYIHIYAFIYTYIIPLCPHYIPLYAWFIPMFAQIPSITRSLLFFFRTIMASRPLCDECYAENDGFYIWQCVKTLYPCSSHQNSWVKMDVNNPLKMYL